ncbi:hypothetical protein [Cognatishimia sp. MH4019]|uniref:helix-turn-helix transcriptional regulator n=1 Tax=Cognatishimia sp. MH4019 TaxID=2854030 RepID=UPI001CD64F9E|nr:hypothetical protein [Cognatishimia sp. MH4019]
MTPRQQTAALSMLSTAMDETHDGLAQFTHQMSTLQDMPSFWWNDVPVWLTETPVDPLHRWPILSTREDMVSITRSVRAGAFQLPLTALAQVLNDKQETPLSTAEFCLFVDLAQGLTLEESAARAGLATSTRRKQLQSVFGKLCVKSQAELISLASQLVHRLQTHLEDQLKGQSEHWGAYLPHLPNGVRYGTLGTRGTSQVRYLDIGPVSGQPVLILHPMIFPNIDAMDVALFHQLGWRTIWPIREGCLSLQTSRDKNWARHCAKTVKDLYTTYQFMADTPIPVIALVSSGSYAVEFARTHSNCVSRIDFVSTCFSAGGRKTRDVYFGDFLLRNLRSNGRMAMLAIRHLAGRVHDKDRLEKTLRRVFASSPPDQVQLDADFATEARTDRLKTAILSSIDAMRHDYLAQLHFSWRIAKSLGVPMQFWHGAEDKVHCLDDLTDLARNVSGHAPEVIPTMGHLTQGAPLRDAFEGIAAAYLK